MDTISLPYSSRREYSSELHGDSGMLATHSYAQTNIQLYKQLRSDGYLVEDIHSVRKTYDVAKELFACLYCSSGKTYLAHLVGVGSILGSLHVPTPMIMAGILHDVYEMGDFGKRWTLDQKKWFVQKAVGLDLDHYLEGYVALEWTRETIPSIRSQLSQLSPMEREVLTIRLAKELEDLLDGGILFCPDAEQRRLHFRDLGLLHIEMAEFLGHASLAMELKQAIHNILDAPAITPVNPKGGWRSPDPFRLIPFSYTYGPFTTLCHSVARGIQYLVRSH